MEKHDTIILVDADVIIHLLKAEKLSVLKDLYNGRVYILDYVLEELKSITPQLSLMLGLGVITEMKFPTSSPEIFLEYNRLKRTMGKGESACMAVCRYQENILASSNLKDIKPYCEEHKIAYLTTMDILSVAYQKGVLTLADADYCIYQIKSRGSKLPKYDKIQDYIKYEFDQKKLTY